MNNKNKFYIIRFIVGLIYLTLSILVYIITSNMVVYIIICILCSYMFWKTTFELYKETFKKEVE